MTLVISKVFTYDADAATYIQAVETADAQALEPATRKAINNFVIGCKQDGIWPAIKASCILAGARTLSGALVPLAGTAPTNNNFVSGDYNRKTGLVGNGSNKYLNSKFVITSVAQNNIHLVVYVSNLPASATHIGKISGAASSSGSMQLVSIGARSRSATIDASFPLAVAPTFIGTSRNVSTGFTWRANKVTYSAVRTSEPSASDELGVFGLPTVSIYGSERIAFYSMGESLDLALLDARVTDLINAFAVTIP